ncbi:MAG: DNA-3-methyladenine glycosylase I [Geminicoccaceae bacterium]|nr:DNA-3-methyladenine glycosylase I [Geminicoccaceae bacterium]
MTARTTAGDGLVPGSDGRMRCFWCAGDPVYEGYHDREWGRPAYEDRALFEKLCLETFQAGLSWRLILARRAALRRAFAGFEPFALARFAESDIARLLADPAIVRHRGKIEAVIANARAVCGLIEREGSLSAFVWRFAPDPARHRRPNSRAEFVARTESPESRALARALRERGFRFLGPVTIYAFMQAMGLVNDHVLGCPAGEVRAAAGAGSPVEGSG